MKRDARIGEAEARKDAQIKEAIAEEERMASRFLNDTEIAKAQRDFELKKAAYDVEVQTKKAEAELAYELQAAKTKQRIKEEQMQIKAREIIRQYLAEFKFSSDLGGGAHPGNCCSGPGDATSRA